MAEKINFDKVLFSDFHIHSRFSRACSTNITIENLVKWAKIKGLNLLGTGDFTHPLWLKEIKEKLVDNGKGLYYYQDFPFIITGEISLIYTQGHGRRIHLVILVPNLEIADKINSYLDTKGRRDYDGRPIFKIPGDEFVKDMKNISEDIEVIPAHCLLPETLIHVNNSVKKIKEVQVGDFVLTHNNRWREVKEVLSHNYEGKNIKIIPWYFREGVVATPEHPFYGVKSYKCNWIKGLCKKSCSKLNECKNRRFENYLREWIPACELKKGDFLVYPRLKEERDIKQIDLSDYLCDYKKISNEFIIPKEARNHTGKLKKIIKIDEKFCRLLGYFLSEGYLIKDRGIGFSFHSKEREYAQEVISTIKEYFGFEITTIDSRRNNQCDLIFSSKLLNSFFNNFYFNNIKKANEKFIPLKFANLSKDKLAEIFRGWWRGDAGYTVSRQLANQMKLICLKLGIIPSIRIDSIADYKKRGKHFIKGREIIAKNDLIAFSNLSFFEEDYGMLNEPCFKKSINKINRKHGWLDNDYVYLPIKKIESKNYSGEVYNLEVEEDNSFTCEFACVHNCWTPWFGIFGSMSGFDSLKECFKEQFENIFAIETGMSSDPEMNWRIKELENKSIVSFSDNFIN
jgi:PHP family Zn ribbon phosphoesterase